MPPLFAYGTLMLPEIFTEVTGAPPPASVAATLPDHRRHRVNGECWPAVIPEHGASVDGLLYLDVPEVLWPRLDAFEGPDYRRVTATVATATADRMVAAYYLLDDSRRGILSLEPWSLDSFRDEIRRRLRGRSQARRQSPFP